MTLFLFLLVGVAFWALHVDKRNRRKAAVILQTSQKRNTSSATADNNNDTTEKLDFLRKASNTGEIIKIIYYGGSHPGETREIAPRRFNGNKLVAYCGRDGIEKSFFIDKIAILNEAETVLYGGQATPTFTTLKEVYDAHGSTWEQSGWCVISDNNSIGLYKRKKKDGTPLKYPHIWINYNEETYDYTEISSGESINIYKKSAKPWDVGGKGVSGGQFKYLDKAIIRFLEIVSNYPINRPTG